jgi:DNA-binding Xre family transcriptional regulator
MAKDLGVSQSCLSRIENGTREIRLEVLHKLCKVLDLEGEIFRYLKTGKF